MFMYLFKALIIVNIGLASVIMMHADYTSTYNIYLINFGIDVNTQCIFDIINMYCKVPYSPPPPFDH